MGCEVFSALCQRHLLTFKGDIPPDPEPLGESAESLEVSPSVKDDVFSEDILPSMTKYDWYKAQRDDPSVLRVISCLERALKEREVSGTGETNLEHPEAKLLLREWKRLVRRDGVLYRWWTERSNKVYQLVLPEQLREQALQDLHGELTVCYILSVSVATKDQKARAGAKALWENLIVHHGVPSHLLSDQGRL